MANESPVVITRADAKARGLTRFFTGEPCKLGHVCERSVSSRRCLECSRLSDAGRRQDQSFLEKRNAYLRTYYLKNREIAIRRAQGWYLTNLGKKRAYDRARYAARKDIVKATVAAWRQANPGRHEEIIREWRAKNKDKVSDYNRAWRHRNRFSSYQNVRNRRERMRGSARLSHKDIREIYEAQKGRCAICRISLRGKYELDHIIPLALGGETSRANSQLLCMPCNRRKGAKDPIEFMRSLGRLI